MNVKTLLEEEVVSQLEGMKDRSMEPDEYKTTIDGVTKLTDRLIEMEKQESEKQLKIEEQKIDKKDRFVKNCVACFTAVSGVGVAIWGALKSWEFEKEGTITTTFGRHFMNMLRPKK